MIKNYLIIAIRNLWKNKVFSAINILGLSIGITAFLLIINYLRFEYSFDDNHVLKDRIYRVPMIVKEKDGKEQTFAFTYPALAPALKNDFPEVEETARVRMSGGIVTIGDQKMVENSALYYVDPSFLKIFSFPFKQGHAETALIELNDAVLTEETAKKYFPKDAVNGTTGLIGKTIRYRNEDFIIKGILENIPANSHIRFNVLLNYNKYIQMTEGNANTSWGWSDFYTYVLLRPNTFASSLEAKFPAFTERYTGSDMKANGYTNTFKLQPLKDIHLKSIYDYEMAGNGNLTYLKYLGIAALFILFIAWINYINLSTAHSLDRSKEIGVRKVVGAGQFQLIRQFLAESLFLNVFAILLGILLFRFSLPYFSNLIGKEINSLLPLDFKFWIGVITFFVGGTLMAAFYPAFVLSSFNPINAIKKSVGNISPGSSKNRIRTALVISQFVAAIILIAGAIGFYRQLRFMQNKELGINIDQTLVLNQRANVDSSQITSYYAFINEVKSFPSIQSVTASTSVPGSEVGGSSGFALKNSTVNKRCRVLGIDKEFIPAYNLTVLEGRNFTSDKPAVDTLQIMNILVNETAAKVFGFSTLSDILGKELRGAGLHCKVIGLVKDFHQQSLSTHFDPIIFYPEEERNFENFSLKFNTTNLPALLDFVKLKWVQHYPQSPFQYFFLDKRFNAQYNNDKLFASVLWIFTSIAITIACMGLLGLTLFTVAKRKKEIGIRKVLGANVLQISGMITKEFLKLILLAACFALPLAFLLVNQWLKKYAFHIDLGLWFFVVPLAVVLLIAILTVSSQSLRAAMANPVNSLRSE